MARRIVDRRETNSRRDVLRWLCLGPIVAAGSYVQVRAAEPELGGRDVTPLKVTQTVTPAGPTFLTRGMEFGKGKVPKGQTITWVNGAGDVPTQVMFRARHADGSLRFASVTANVPTMGVTGYRVITDSAANPIVIAAVADDRAEFTFTDGTVHIVECKNCMWLSDTIDRGALVNERKGFVQVKPNFAVYFWIRQYADGNRVIRFAVENSGILLPNPQVEQYDVKLFVAGKQVFARTGVNHFWTCRWTQVFDSRHAPAWHIWQGLDQYKATGQAPNYAMVPTKAACDAYLKKFEASLTEDILERGMAIYNGMNATGARPEIALYPRWDVMFLTSGDPRLEQIVTKMGDLAGSWDAHWRYEKTGLPLTPADLPNFSSHYNYQGKPGSAPKQDLKGLKKVLYDDYAHEPSEGLWAYRLTSDDYYLEEVRFFALDDIPKTDPETRGFEKGIVNWGETRARAWSLRGIVDWAYIENDSSPLKAQALTIVANNIASFTDPTILADDHGITKYGDGPEAAPWRVAVAPWMQDFLLLSFCHAHDMGWTGILPAIAWKAKFSLHRTFDLDKRLPAPYHMPVCDGGKPPYWDWPTINTALLTLYAGQLAKLGPDDILHVSNDPTYLSYMLAPLAMCADKAIPRAREAYDNLMARFNAEIARKSKTYPIDPEWAIVPR